MRQRSRRLAAVTSDCLASYASKVRIGSHSVSAAVSFVTSAVFLSGLLGFSLDVGIATQASY